MMKKARGTTCPITMRHLLPIAAVLLVAAVLIAPAAASDYIAENADKRTLSGSGTANDPYLIKTADDLDKIRYYIVETGVADTVDKTGKTTMINSQVITGYFRLENNLDFSTYGKWIPIGIIEANKDVSEKTAFVGTFDGNKKTISNVEIDTSYRGIGLFTRIGDGGTVKSLTMEHCNAICPSGALLADVGIICGKAYDAVFTDITLKDVQVIGSTYAGTLAADVMAGSTPEHRTIITNCHVSDATVSGGAATGGLIGRTHGNCNTTITDCSATNVQVAASGHSVGGLVGILSGGQLASCTNCHANSVTVTSSIADSRAGGLAGTAGMMKISGCTSSGTVNAGENGNTAGGLIAYYETANGEIKLCSSSVAVTAKQTVGGLLGYFSNKAGNILTVVDQCYASGTVTITGVTTDKDGAHTHRAGGLIGHTSNLLVTNSYATGNVIDTVQTTVTTGNAVGVGGLAGTSGAGSLENCYATGSVTSQNSDNVGGLVGYANSASGKIEKCYATGNVQGASNVGGITGKFSGTLKECYATGDATGVSNVGGGIGYLNSGSTIDTAAATGAVTATGENTGGFVGYIYATSTVQNVLATGEVTGTNAGAFMGSGATPANTLKNCYANSESSIAFTGTSSFSYYSPRNCFWTGGVTGMLPSGDEVQGSSGGVKDYYYSKMTFTDADVFVEEELTIVEQQDTVGDAATGTPKHTLTVKSNPENLVTVDADNKITADNAGSGTVSLVLTVNGRDFAFGTVKADVKAAVDFEANGGVGSMEQQIFTGSEKALTKNLFTRVNHLFTEWNTKADGTGTTYTDEQTVSFTKNQTLYAQWIYDGSPIEPNMPTVSIDEATGETTVTATGTVEITVSDSDKKIAVINDPESGTEITVTFETAQPNSGAVSSVTGKVANVQVSYPQSKMTTENGGEAVYSVGIDMKNLTESLPVLNPTFKTDIETLVEAQGAYAPLAMVSASGELTKINGNITEITFTFKVPKTGNSVSKVKAFHIWTDANGKQQIEPANAALDATTNYGYYLITVTGSTFSTYVIAQDNTVTDNSGTTTDPTNPTNPTNPNDPNDPNDPNTPTTGGSSTTQGSSVWMTETQVPTETPTETPDVVPTDIPTTQPTQTPKTPGFGVLAVMAGLGAVAVLRRK